jgi:hypothetical protein
MTQEQSFIPRGLAAYHIFFTNFTGYVTAMTSGAEPVFPHIPPGALGQLNQACAQWQAAYEPTLHPHGPAETAAMRAAFTGSRKVLSHFVQVWIRGFPEIVTPMHLAHMGIPPIDDTPTPVGRPSTVPEFRFVIKRAGLLALPFKDAGSESRARPYGYNGCLVQWEILDAPPAKISDLREHKLATRSPFLLSFPLEDRGKRVYAAMAWQANELIGDFTEIQSELIP